MRQAKFRSDPDQQWREPSNYSDLLQHCKDWEPLNDKDGSQSKSRLTRSHSNHAMPAALDAQVTAKEREQRLQLAE